MALRQLLILLLAAALPAAVSGTVQLKWAKAPPLAEGEVRLEEVRKWGDQVVWVDARSRSKFEREHIPGAVLLNEDEWVRLVGPFLDVWEPAKPVVVYCDGGGCDASHAVAKRIKEELGVDSPIWVLKDGWNAWTRNR